jgi:hypothetical protein
MMQNLIRGGIAAMVFAGCAAPLTAQQTVPEQKVFNLILSALPEEFAAKVALVDPRLAARALEERAAANMWDADLSQVRESTELASILAARRLRPCRAEPTLTNCLQSPEHVYVLFAAPQADGTTITVDVTFASSISASAAFSVETWQYTFDMRSGNTALLRRSMLARGHGRLR